jgi:hypothetical protein
LYWQDAELEGWYPVSMPIEGQSLNITVLSYGDNLEFGLIGCRRNVVHLQRLLGHLEDSLAALEASSCPTAQEVALDACRPDLKRRSKECPTA